MLLEDDVLAVFVTAFSRTLTKYWFRSEGPINMTRHSLRAVGCARTTNSHKTPPANSAMVPAGTLDVSPRDDGIRLSHNSLYCPHAIAAPQWGRVAQVWIGPPRRLCCLPVVLAGGSFGAREVFNGEISLNCFQLATN